MHEFAVKLPEPLEVNPTDPLGVLWPLLSVSVTVEVHVEACPTATVPGEQVTLVEVESGAV